MFPREVLETLAHGCGVTLAGLTGLESDQHSAHSAHAVTQALRHRFGDPEVCTADDQSLWALRFSQSLASTVRRCGEVVLEAARESLPVDVHWLDTAQEKEVPRSLEAILVQWRSGSSGARLEIGRAFASTLHPRKRGDGTAVDNSKGADSFDQPVERVLPRLYGRWELAKGADNRPNCLGKFQLLAALGKRLGVQMLAVAPLEYGATLTNRYREQACRVVAETFAQTGIPLSGKRAQSILKVIQQQAINRRLPPLQHFSVLYRTDSRTWMLVDPNSGLASYAPANNRFDMAYTLLQSCAESAPGASLVVEEPDHERMLQVLLEHTNDAAQTVRGIAAQLHEAASWSELRALFFQSGIAQHLLNSDDAMDVCGNTEQLRLTELVKRYWTKAYPEDPEPTFGVAELPRILETVVYRYLKVAEAAMLTHYQSEVLFGKAFPPLYEVSLVPFRVATATLSHVAFSLSREIGFAAEEVLYSFGIAEGQLYNVASGVWFSRATEHTERARRLLGLQSRFGQLARRLFYSEDGGR